MKITMRVLLGISLLIFGASAQTEAAQPWILYDNFNATFINPGKWSGREVSNSDGLMTDSVREINKNRLHMNIAACGDSSSDKGRKFPSTRVYFRNGEDITAIRTTIKIGNFEVQGCSSNPVPSDARVRITAGLFNVNPSGPQEGSWLGDIFVQLRIRSRADSPDTLRVEAVVQICKDSTCDYYDEVFNKELRTVNKYESVDYSLVWDKDARMVKFSAGKLGGKAVSAKYDYNEVFDGDYPLASKASSKSLHVMGMLANCTDEPWPRVNIDAFFDNVYIKRSSD